mgnify:CR=1 FL=1|jgi:radical SAM-linked protein
MNQPIRLRVRFKKSGPLCYIGHLDVMRFFQKAIRRAGMDVVYTKGFSPHQVMAFAAPLGVGLESNGEYMDIEVNSITSCRDAAESLNRAGVPGIEVVSVKILPPEAGNAMASVAAAAYRVGFREGMAPKLDLAGAVPGFLAQDRILITKETKKGSREVDLRPGIFCLEYAENALWMLVDASSGGNIKPLQVVEALLAGSGEVLKDNALWVIREDMYARTPGTEGREGLVSLDEIGHVC